MDKHRAFLIVKYVDEIVSDIPLGTRGFFARTVELGGNAHLSKDFFDTKIESFTTVDLQYSYSFGEALLMADSTVTVGVQNVGDEDPPVIANVTAYDGTLHDGRGRIWFLRFSGNL